MVPVRRSSVRFARRATATPRSIPSQFPRSSAVFKCLAAAVVSAAVLAPVVLESTPAQALLVNNAESLIYKSIPESRAVLPFVLKGIAALFLLQFVASLFATKSPKTTP